jgi:hypothetical protein
VRWSNATEREIGSTWVLSLFDPALNNDVLIAAITGVEIVATEGKSVTTVRNLLEEAVE